MIAKPRFVSQAIFTFGLISHIKSLVIWWHIGVKNDQHRIACTIDDFWRHIDGLVVGVVVTNQKLWLKNVKDIAIIIVMFPVFVTQNKCVLPVLKVPDLLYHSHICLVTCTFIPMKQSYLSRKYCLTVFCLSPISRIPFTGVICALGVSLVT